MAKEVPDLNHWSEYAKRWKLVAPPFKPVEQDIKNYWKAAEKWIKRHGAPNVLILGVTPQLFNLPWPDKTGFLAVDSNQAMIDMVWPGLKEDTMCADWLDMNLPDGSRDMVLCDGGLEAQPYPQGQQQLIRNIRNVLSGQGLCIFRLYALPTKRESLDIIFEDMLGGRIPNRAVLELRLAMALQKSADEGVTFGMIWQAVHEVVPDLKSLIGRTGWTPDDTLELDVHRGSAVRFNYTTIDQVIEMFCNDPGGFVLDSISTPDYVLGDRCPVIVFQRC